MKLLEYEAKTILRAAGVPTPASVVITRNSTPDLAVPVVIKSQVPIGGRGKLGGVVIVDSTNDIMTTVDRLFNLKISDYIPTTLLAEDKLAIQHEYYISLIINKRTAVIELVAHTNGGVEVESQVGFGRWYMVGGIWQVAGSDPQHDDGLLPKNGNWDQIGEMLAEYLDLPGQTFALQDLIEKLYRCFVKNDVLSG